MKKIILETVTGERFEQIGTMALRDPITQELCTSEPLFVRVGSRAAGHAPSDPTALNGVAMLFAEKFKQYVEGEDKARRGTESL
jgi:hypothetical protein